MIATAEHKQRDEWVLADEAFHRALLKSNPNRRLRDVGLMHRDLAQRAHFVAIRLLPLDQLMKSTRQRKRLIKLIMSGGEATAVKNHQVQREKGANMLVRVLRQYHLTQI
jgi:DNA-binding FadR family transcriptional regulator